MSGALQAVFQNQRSFDGPSGQQEFTTVGTYSHEMAEVGVFVMEIKFQLLPVTHIPLLLVLAALVALSILVQAVRAVAVRLIAQVLWP